MSVTGAQGTGGAVSGRSKWLDTGEIASYHGAGNFLAFHITPGDDGATTEAGIVPAAAGLATLDDDGLLLVKITDPAAEQLEVVTTLDGETLTQTFTLENVTLDPEPEPAIPDLAIVGGPAQELGKITASLSGQSRFQVELGIPGGDSGYMPVDGATAVYRFADDGIAEIERDEYEPAVLIFHALAAGNTTFTATARGIADGKLHTGTATVTVTE